MDCGPLPEHGETTLGTILEDPKNTLSSLSTIDKNCLEQYPDIVASESSNWDLTVEQTQYMGRREVGVRIHCPIARLERFSGSVAKEELV